MTDQTPDDPAPSAAVARQDRTRKLMLAAIVLFGVIGVFLQFRLAAKREAAADAAANRPEVRAREALVNADRATLDKDYKAAWAALQTASGALDEAFAERPDARDVQRIVDVAQTLIDHDPETRVTVMPVELALSQLKESFRHLRSEEQLDREYQRYLDSL